MILVRQALLVCFGMAPSLVFAQDTLHPTPVFGSLLQVTLALLLVIAAIAAGAWLLRRFGAGQIGGGQALRVIGGVMLSQRERLVVVEVGDTWLVVGVAPGQVTAVHTMPRPPQAETIAAAVNAQAGFADRLKEAWRKRGGA